MRALITDQDLTDYALDELEPNQRIYVESMLAVSEECRNDVYEIIDLAMLLEEGLEGEEEQAAVGLTSVQRQALLSIKPRQRYGQKAVAALAAAAAVAFAITHPTFWQMKGSEQQVARVSTETSQQVTSAVNAEAAPTFITQLFKWRELADDPALKKWFNSEWFTLDHASQNTIFNTSPALNRDPMPRGTFEVMP